MSQDYIQNLSTRLSEVLADIGVDERIVGKRRRTFLLRESLQNSFHLLDDVNVKSEHYFGSQSEGTTTQGLDSDIDLLICDHNGFNIITDSNKWEPGVRNLLMIQNETVSSGYCLLQLILNIDVPLLKPHHLPVENLFRDSSGRLLLRNTILNEMATEILDKEPLFEFVRHGPAYTLIVNADLVYAFFCKSWPLQWLDQQGVGQWPSDDMKKYCTNTGCFIVGVGRKGSDKEELEWRISTSLAERCLMFSLNITQIRCYVLMKMLIKTYIKPDYDDAISSYMCKTVLFQSVANTHSNIWRESNLIPCLLRCLLNLYNCVLNESCPQFIIPKNDLMTGHFAHESKSRILKKLHLIMICKENALVGIQCDDLGARLWWKFKNVSQLKINDIISGKLLLSTAENLDNNILRCLVSIDNCSYKLTIQTLLKYIFKLNNISNEGQALDQKACALLTPWFYTTLGSVLASRSIKQYNRISPNALSWISMGLNTDVSSSKLKQASMFYCIGDIHRTKVVLRDIKENYNLNIVEPICNCHKFINQSTRTGFNAISVNYNEEALQYTAAFCVRFLQREINCVPHELRYEFFKSTKDDLAFRSQFDRWMDWAVVDSLPYFYCLQYKTYSYLGRQDDKQGALSNLLKAIDQEPNLGHRETALNLLGQCMEEEDRANDASNCYVLSLSLRGRNNAAKVHICRLLSKLVNYPARVQSFQ